MQSRLLIFSTLLLLCVGPDSPAQQAGSVSSTPEAVGGISPERHRRALEFVELTGARARLEADVDKMMQAGEDEMRKQGSSYDPEYVAEWTRRMRSRFNPNDYLAVMVRVFESHFSEAELAELIRAKSDRSDDKQAALSEPLKTKLASEGVTIQSEILGGCAQVGAKIGGEIGQELQKEHPAWVKTSPTK